MSDQAVLLPKCSPHAMGESFWQKDSLIIHILLELRLIMISRPVANFAQQSLVHVILPKGPINQFKTVQQSRQQALRAYCPNIHSVLSSVQTVLKCIKRPNALPARNIFGWLQPSNQIKSYFSKQNQNPYKMREGNSSHIPNLVDFFLIWTSSST